MPVTYRTQPCVHVVPYRYSILVTLTQLFYLGCIQMQRDKAAASSRKDPHNNYGVGRGSKIVREWWEIPREYIQVGKELGSGAFGEVKKAVLTKKDDETIVCAVKMLKSKRKLSLQ